VTRQHEQDSKEDETSDLDDKVEGSPLLYTDPCLPEHMVEAHLQSPP